jgi:hypothetical protein
MRGRPWRGEPTHATPNIITLPHNHIRLITARKPTILITTANTTDAEGQRCEPRSGVGDALGAGQLAAVEPEGCAPLPPAAGRRADYWRVEPDVGRVANGVPARVDRLRSLGNALVPQIAEWIGWRIIAYEEGRLAA